MKSTGKWNVRKVVRFKMLDEINEEVAERSGNAPTGSDAYLAHFPTSWSAVVETLTDEQHEEFQALANEWNEGDIPEEVQRRCVIILL